jgi:hypothetical protein
METTRAVICQWAEDKIVFCCVVGFGSRFGDRFRSELDPSRPAVRADSDIDLAMRTRDDPDDLRWFPQNHNWPRPRDVWACELSALVRLPVQVVTGRPRTTGGGDVWNGIQRSRVLLYRASEYVCTAPDCLCRAVPKA